MCRYQWLLLSLLTSASVAEPTDTSGFGDNWQQSDRTLSYQRWESGHVDFYRYRQQQVEWQQAVNEDMQFSFRVSKVDKTLSACPNSHRISELAFSVVPQFRFAEDVSVGFGWQLAHAGELSLSQSRAIPLGSRQGWLVNAQVALAEQQSLLLTLDGVEYQNRFDSGRQDGENFRETQLHLSYSVTF